MVIVADKPALASAPLGRLANAFAQAAVSTPSVVFASADTMTKTAVMPEGAERALQQLNTAYQRMLSAINLRLFNPDRIEEYIRRAERRAGVDMTDLEKDRIRRLARSGDSRMLRLLCLELRVGVPKKEQADAERAFGQLLLARHDRPALQRFLDNPKSDDNLKAHVRAILMMGQVEAWMNRADEWKRRLTPKLPFIFSNN